MKNNQHSVYRCSFCGRSAEDVETLISGPNVHICNNCVFNANEIISRHRKQLSPSQKRHFVPPHALVEELDKYVVGQDKAKKILAVSVYNHYKRIEDISTEKGVEIEKSNILLLGPTGTGKTLLARTLAKILNVPFTIADSTVLTEAGYVGEDVENILVRLFQASNYNLEQTQRGIIYIDEIDKISRKSGNPSITRDVSGEGVQQAILKMLEGTIASIPPKGGRKHPEQNLVNIDTKNILFICGGAFEGLEDVIRRRVGDKNIGFEKNINKRNHYSTTELYRKVEPEDLLQFGLIPELIGRLPVIGTLEELGEDALFSILTQPENALVKQYQKLLDLENINLEFQEQSLREIVKIAVKRKTGARSLRAIMESIMLDIMYQSPQMEGLESIIITPDVVLKGAEPQYGFATKKRLA
jgi:ATP-dependent Clp protease ATP-binding subunit ClpX